MTKRHVITLIVILVITISAIMIIRSEQKYPSLTYGELIENQFTSPTLRWLLEVGNIVEVEVSDTIWYKNDDVGIMFMVPETIDPQNIVIDVDYDRNHYPQGIKQLHIEISNSGILVKDDASQLNYVDLRIENPELNPINQEIHSYRDFYQKKFFANLEGEPSIFQVNPDNPTELAKLGYYHGSHFINVYTDSLDEISFAVFLSSIRTY